MARPLRLELPGGIYHVTSRGNAKADIFLDDDDRVVWLKLFDEVCMRFHWICHAYCMMDNHYHVVIETVEGNLSKGMRQLNGVYTQKFNRRHDRVGHVYQGRYKAILVEKDSYLLELSRYVVLNPVRAGMQSDVENWPWSSYLATVNKATPIKSLQADWLLGQFGRNRNRAIIQYANFVREGFGLPPVWEALNSQIFLGDNEFVKKMQNQIQAKPEELKEIPRAQRRAIAHPLEYYVNTFESAKEGMSKAYKAGDFTLQQIAQAYGVHYSTVSRAVKRYGQKE